MVGAEIRRVYCKDSEESSPTGLVRRCAEEKEHRIGTARLDTFLKGSSPGIHHCRLNVPLLLPLEAFYPLFRQFADTHG